MKWNRYNYYTLLIPLVLGINTIVEVSAGIEIEQGNLNSNGNETQELNKSRATSCKAFDKPGVHLIEVPGMGPFEVLCSDNIMGSGWTIIQQRINFTEDFNRDWNSYRDGFGSFEGDFWLGLNKIHQITQSQRHELLILRYMVFFMPILLDSRYNNFKVGSEDERFALTLGEFNRTTYKRNEMETNEHKKFTTYDSDNDEWESGNCAEKYRSGWWYSSCGVSNLNGRYQPFIDNSIFLTMDTESIHWVNIIYQKVQMLIRPIN